MGGPKLLQKGDCLSEGKTNNSALVMSKKKYVYRDGKMVEKDGPEDELRMFIDPGHPRGIGGLYTTIYDDGLPNLTPEEYDALSQALGGEATNKFIKEKFSSIPKDKTLPGGVHIPEPTYLEVEPAEDQRF